MINKIKDKRLIKKLFILMLIIQPLLNLNILYTDKVMDIFKFSPSTIIRLLMALILAFMVFISKKKGKQEKFIFIYTILYVIYIFLHHYNAISFAANVTGEYKYSIVSELFYLFRMFIPVLIVYITANVDLNHMDLRKILKIVILSFSIVIIISNLFTFGIKSYGYGTIKYNIFSWFNESGGVYSDYLTIGLFIGTNRLGALLVSLLPLSIYYYFTDKKNSFMGIIFLQILSLIMIGTRTATYAFILITPVMILIYLYLSLVRKNVDFSTKKIIILVIVFVLFTLLAINSPVNNRDEYNDLNNAEKTNEVLEEENKDKLEKIFAKYDNEFKNNLLCTNCEAQEEMVNFIEENYNKLYISYEYASIYDYKHDYLFWTNIINLPFSERNNGRKIQYLISERILELNNNYNKDRLFGMGYSRFKNADLYLEQDFLVQYYTCGIIGVILFILPYVASLICAAIYIIKNFRKKLDFDLLTYCFCLCLFLISGYIGGHVLDEMITYTFMSVFCGLILKKCFSKYSDDKIVKDETDLISIIIPAYNVEDYLEECIESILNQQNLECNIEIIVINDCSSDGTLKICNKYKNEGKIILINNKENKRQAYSRNIGIKKSKGNYIVFVDSDDLLYDNALSTLYREIKKTDADMVMARLNSFNSKGYYGYYSDKYMNVYKSGNIYDNMELINCISICSKIYKRDFLSGIEFLNDTFHEDNSFTLTAYFKAKNIVVLPEYLYYRRIREDENNLSTMQKLNYKTFVDLIKNYNYVLENIDGKIPKSLKFYMIRKLDNTIIKYVDEKEYQKALDNLTDFINKNFNSKMYITYHRIYFIMVKVYGRMKKYAKKK
ncbi:MAG: O-antigen ligase family protein [Bacilli bacterium]